MQQIVRRILQLSVILLLVAIPYLHLYGAWMAQGGHRQEPLPGPLQALRATVGRLEEPERVTSFLNGSLWTMTVGRLRLSDPLAVLESLAAAKSVRWSFVVSALIPVVLTVLLGRVFCGWLCPLHLVFEMTAWLRRGLRRWLGWKPHELVFDRRNRYRLLGGGLLVALAFNTPVFALFYPPAVLGREVFYAVFYGPVGFGLGFLGVLVLFELALAERSWCRSLCPGGAVYSFLSGKRLVRIRRDDDTCIECAECDHACPFDLRPMTAAEVGGECDNCGLCVASCQPGALRQVLSWPTARIPDRERMDKSNDLAKT